MKEKTMFSFFKKNPLKKLISEYENKLKEAVQAQRNGRIDEYAELSSEADKILKEIESIEKKNASEPIN